MELHYFLSRVTLNLCVTFKVTMGGLFEKKEI